MAKTPKIKHRARVTLIDSEGQQYHCAWHKDGIHESVDLHSCGAFLRVPVPTRVGVPAKFTVVVEYRA